MLVLMFFGQEDKNRGILQQALFYYKRINIFSFKLRLNSDRHPRLTINFVGRKKAPKIKVSCIEDCGGQKCTKNCTRCCGIQSAVL